MRLNPDPLVSLYSELGENGADRVVCRAMEEMAARLSEMQKLADEEALADLVRTARLLSTLGDQIGMATFSRVARDVARAAASGDVTAQAATLARLIRIGERSLTAVWDLRGMTS